MRIIQFLLMQSDVNARDNYNSTPLHFAAVRGNVVAARELLASKDVLVNVRLRLTSFTPTLRQNQNTNRLPSA